MRLVQFECSGRRGVGVELVDGGDVVDVNSSDPALPTDMRAFIAGGDANLQAARKAIDSGKFVLNRETVRLLAPITGPDKVVCVGMNYRDHCVEMDKPIPTEPVVFAKFPSTIIGPTDSIPYPKVTTQLDWEGELVVIIGKKSKDVQVEQAMECVLGYTAAFDVSARDWQARNGGQVLLAKAMDGFCPLGPAIVTKDAVGDPHNLRIWTDVNGVRKQDSNTDQLIFTIPKLVAFISQFTTLLPGDVILTGTPPGIGVSRTPPEFLQRGDVVEIGIEKIGATRNKIV